MTKTTSIRLDDSLAARLDELAAAVNRPRSWLIEQAICDYLDKQASQAQAIQEALDEYRAGTATTKPHGQVMRDLETRISTLRKQGAGVLAALEQVFRGNPVGLCLA